MKSLRYVVAVSLGLAGCRTAYHVVTAPVRVLHHPHDKPATSDVVQPGGPVSPAASPTPALRRVVERNPPPTLATPSPQPIRASVRPSVSSPPRKDATVVEFPVAKPVPDKPGYVFSPTDPTKYVDVSGYAKGSKVKDPYSGKIFLVP